MIYNLYGKSKGIWWQSKFIFGTINSQWFWQISDNVLANISVYNEQIILVLMWFVKSQICHTMVYNMPGKTTGIVWKSGWTWFMQQPVKFGNGIYMITMFLKYQRMVVLFWNAHNIFRYWLVCRF